VVVIQDKNLLKQISQMDAAAWFGAKGRCTFRDGPKAKVEFHSWEFVPGQNFLVEVHIRKGTKAVFGFADYAAPGEHRVSMSTKGTQIVEMDKDGAHAVAGQAIRETTLTLAPEQQKVCPDD
jgi:type VI secretion system protein